MLLICRKAKDCILKVKALSSFLLSLLLGECVFGDKIFPPDLTDYYGGIHYKGWTRVTNKDAEIPSGMVWLPLRAYILKEAIHHPETLIQFVFISQDVDPATSKKRKITMARGDVTAEKIEAGHVKFKGEGTNPKISHYFVHREQATSAGRAGTIDGMKYDFWDEKKESFPLNTPLNTFPEDATILIDE